MTDEKLNAGIAKYGKLVGLTAAARLLDVSRYKVRTLAFEGVITAERVANRMHVDVTTLPRHAQERYVKEQDAQYAARMQ